MKNNEESGRDWNLFHTTASAMATPPSVRGGFRSASVVSNSVVAYGESVIVLITDDSSSSFCAVV